MTASIESGDIAAVPVEREPSTPRERWLARRMRRTWGASEVPVLLAARGLLSLDGLPVHSREDLEVSKRHGVPRYLARKAGLMAPTRMGDRDRLDRLELQLYRLWRDRWAAEDGILDPHHATEAPLWCLPIRDLGSDCLSATPDGWGEDAITGALALCELKCPPTREAWSLYGERWTAQAQAQMAGCDAVTTVVVVGEGWVLPREEGPVTRHVVERDEVRIAQIREVCTEAWAEVERLRARRMGT